MQNLLSIIRSVSEKTWLIVSVQWLMASLCHSNTDANELFDLSLEDLSRLEVNIASPKRERIIDTPAITSAYEIADMENLGLNTLEDILSFVPGIVVQDSAIGSKAVMIRGIVEAFNQKVLFLLDGVPYWQASHGGIPLLGMSAQHIQRIEVLRGPGAVIFGSNATSGVINVITKSNQGTHAELTYGSNQSNKVSFYSAKSTNGLSIKWGGHYKRTEGFNAQYKNRPLLPIYPSDTPTDATFNKQQASHSLWTSVKNDSWKINLHHFASENDGLAAAGSTINRSTLNYTGTLLATEYAQTSNLGDLKFFADFNNFSLEIPTESLIAVGNNGTQQFEHSGYNNNRARVGVHHYKVLSNTLDVQSGLEVENRATGEYQNVDGSGEVISTSMMAHDVNEYSVFTQLDLHQESYRLITGFRYTQNDSAGNNFLPRLSLIHPIDDNQTLKLLYSSAFKSPSFIQQYINIPPNVVRGDPDLKAETVTSTELAYSAQYKRHLFVASIYQTHAKNFIFRSADNDGEVVFSNTDSFTRQGLDIDYRLARRQTQWYANLSWQFEGNQVMDNDATALFTPEWTLNIGSSYQHSKSVSYGMSWRHIGERDTLSALNIINAQFSVKPTQQLSASLIVENLLGETMLHPDIQNFQSDKPIQSASKHPAVYGRLSYTF